MNIPWRRRLSAKQVQVTVLAALMLGFTFSLFELALYVRGEQESRNDAVTQVMDMLNEPAAQAAYALDEQLAGRVVNGLLLYRPILRAEIYDNYGRRMAMQQRDDIEGNWLTHLVDAQDEVRTRPLYAARGQELVGELRVVVDGDQFASNVLNRIWVVIGTGFVRNLILALVLVVLFYYTLTRPLLGLVEQLGRVDAEHPSARRLEMPAYHGDDEFGLLVARINDILTASARHLDDRDRERQLLRAVLDNLPARVTVKDADRRYMLLNRAAEQMFGVDMSTLLGRRIEDCELPKLDATNRQLFLERANENDLLLLKTGQAVLNFESTFSDTDGRLVTALQSKVPMRGADGRIIGILTIATDITERKQAEQALDAANTQLRAQADDLERLAISLAREREHAIAANRAKSEFLANMSHELRTPLNAVIGFAEVIVLRMWGASSDRYFDYAQDIVISARHLLNVINDILDMSKIEAGRYELALEPTEIGQAVEDCLTIVKGRARESRVVLVNELSAGSLPLLRLDTRAVKQVLLNLLSNAIKFTPAGGQVRIGGRLEPDGSVVLFVRDTGIGIRQEDIGRIFEPFWQGDPSIRRRSEGTGLGLAISRKFMELHGGTLEISSGLGEGTTATISFPPDTPDK
jgi:PAS domain S-box-containing protein